MTPEQYREACLTLFTSVEQSRGIYAAGRFLGSPRSSVRWAAGAARVPRSVELLLALLIELKRLHKIRALPIEITPEMVAGLID